MDMGQSQPCSLAARPQVPLPEDILTCPLRYSQFSSPAQPWAVPKVLPKELPSSRIPKLLHFMGVEGSVAQEALKYFEKAGLH